MRFNPLLPAPNTNTNRGRAGAVGPSVPWCPSQLHTGAFWASLFWNH